MKGKLFLVEWDVDVATRQADALRRDGWQVDVESENGGRAYRHIRTSVPDAIVIDLRSKPSHGREVGSALRELRATRSVPIVCIEEGEEAREQTRARIDGVRFSSPETLSWTVADATRERRAISKVTARGRTQRKSSRPRG
jgi:DNA-binding response OmpR family regulator